MRISYKEKWQEADQHNSKLQADNAKLRSEAEAMKGEIARLNRLLEAAPEVRAAKAQAEAVAIVGLAGIARHMKVARLTPQQWVQRKLLPPPDFPDIAGEPIWKVSTIKEKFVIPTRRVWYDDPDEELSPAA
jgi:hypothetical protein